MNTKIALLSACALALSAGAANADIVFQNASNNGFFTPFNSGNASIVKYGDSGYLGFGPTNTLTSITLGLAVFGGTGAGTTDIIFTYNDGDPSGNFLFGPGTLLHTATLTNVALPSAAAGPQFFNVTIPLPNIVTDGNFNNVGWTVSLANYNYSGEFGFQCSTASGQSTGFYTNNAAFYNGSSWSLFAFGPNPDTGVANFVATINNNVPAPASAALLALSGLVASRRRRA